MNTQVAKFIKQYPEHYIAQVISRVFWPPATVSVLVHGEHEDILTLNLDGSHRLPGGFLEKDENFKEAARREVKEETGFDVEIHDLLDIRHNESGGPNIFFEAEIKDGELESSWEGDVSFVPKDEVKERVWKLDHSHIHEYLFPDEEN
jgi:ADP-ribose pyrophosphatase YjhB (NUDIX family)